jgi:hypothetical protein
MEPPPWVGRATYHVAEGGVTIRRAPLESTGAVGLAARNVLEWGMPVWFEQGRHPSNHAARRLEGGSFQHPGFFRRGAALPRDVEDDYRWDSIGFRVALPPEALDDGGPSPAGGPQSARFEAICEAPPDE